MISCECIASAYPDERKTTMKYNRIVSGTFLQRPNRFIAHVRINGTEEICHVKNTGRCRELLVPGCTVYCAVSDNLQRKTKFDLIAVEKITETGILLVNMDSQAPNAAVKEWLQSGASPFGKLDVIKPENKYGNSRFDFYLEKEKRKIFLEVKGVTLENNGVVLFPDAPTERGVKHLQELIRCQAEGFEASVLFVAQMENALYFTPNRKTHPQFANALCEAQKAGVHLLAYTCNVMPNEMKIDKELEIML
jgi:sugar fermentation stimulation protein A